MKTPPNSQSLRASRIMTAVILFCGLHSVSAQTLGDCTEQVLSAPTESSVRVRLTGVNQWPVNPICFWTAEGTRADGNTYRWSATLIGDGLVENPEPFPSYVNVAVSFRYQVFSGSLLLGSQSLVLNCFCPYPSEGFTEVVISDPAKRTPPEGERASWGGDVFGDTTGFPSLAFMGTISLDSANDLTVDIVFTGGTPPVPTVNDLIAAVNNSSLSEERKHTLLVTLEAANDAFTSGDCPGGINKLETFKNKVRAQVSGVDPALAAALLATTQEIIDAGCGG
jgi:hypothetical protein